MSRIDPIVIVSATRTPMGAFQGSLKDLTAPEIGAIALKAALDRAGLDAVDEVLMGNVLPAGIGQNPARQAALGAGLGKSACRGQSLIIGKRLAGAADRRRNRQRSLGCRRRRGRCGGHLLLK